MVAAANENKRVQIKTTQQPSVSYLDITKRNPVTTQSHLNPKQQPSDHCGHFAPTHPAQPNAAKTKNDQKKKHKTHAKPTSSALRVHLKPHNDSANDFVVFNVQAPQRVSLRLEFLMDSTEVRLNDKEYMKKWHDALVENEKVEKVKVMRERELKEINRVKQLVINGHMKPPDDLRYLYKHPVFRVNAMLRRLEKHKADFFDVTKPLDKVSNIQPFEFDRNGKFFRYMHERDSIWIPSEERIALQEKLDGKIARARQRLREKRRKEYEHTKAVRLLYQNKDDDNRPIGDYITSVTDEGSSSGSTPSNDSDKRKQKERRMHREREKHHRESNRMAAKDKQRAQYLAKRELERKAREEERIRIRDMKLNEDRENERRQIIEKHRARIERYENPTRNEPTPSIMNEYKKYTDIFKMQDTPPQLKEEDSFKALRKKYELRGTKQFESYRPPKNNLIDNFEDISTTDDLYCQARAVRGVYEREQRRADDFMLKLNRLF